MEFSEGGLGFRGWDRDWMKNSFWDSFLVLVRHFCFGYGKCGISNPPALSRTQSQERTVEGEMGNGNELLYRCCVGREG